MVFMFLVAQGRPADGRAERRRAHLRGVRGPPGPAQGHEGRAWADRRVDHGEQRPWLGRRRRKEEGRARPVAADPEFIQTLNERSKKVHFFEFILFHIQNIENSVLFSEQTR